jgi:hypothetical protein
MTLMASQANPVSIRAPREHGQAICVPQGAAAYAVWQSNASILESASFRDWGEDLTELRQLARSEVVTAAQNYSAQYRNIGPVSEGQPILGSGHQPQLFHPGGILSPSNASRYRLPETRSAFWRLSSATNSGIRFGSCWPSQSMVTKTS